MEQDRNNSTLETLCGLRTIVPQTPGQVLQRHGNRLYDISVDGQIWKRHANQLRLRVSNDPCFPESTSELAELPLLPRSMPAHMTEEGQRNPLLRSDHKSKQRTVPQQRRLLSATQGIAGQRQARSRRAPERLMVDPKRKDEFDVAPPVAEQFVRRGNCLCTALRAISFEMLVSVEQGNFEGRRVFAPEAKAVIAHVKQFFAAGLKNISGPWNRFRFSHSDNCHGVRHLVKDIPGNWYDAMTWIGGKYDWMVDDWFWVDGAPFSYTNWRWNEPNNYSGDEYCVE
ncbi:hypothetical protein OSTOST_12077, partial [Ostertagia ostertagi]